MEAEKKINQWAEVGSLGLSAYAGWIREAYHADLYWPTCEPLYSRIYRSDPEVSICRVMLETLSGQQSVSYQLDPEIDDPTDDDLAAVDFGNTALSDIEGGIDKWLTSCVSRVPFFGWGWWEAIPGLRQSGWKSPNGDGWQSKFGDGLIGFRSLAFRRYSTFSGWQMDDKTGRLTGLEQSDPPNPTVIIPLERSLHITFGDADNPEGLATMEALWRLERIKYGLEIIQGIGFEHAAGHVKFKATETLTADDHANIKKAARAVLTAQEGNYMALPAHIDGEVIDIPFTAATPILDAIRYYGILKLALLGMQWAALGTMSPYGSYSQTSDANAFFLGIYNAMVDGFVRQADQQIGKRLFEYQVNRAAFPNMTRRPVLTVTKAEKSVNLAELGAFLQATAAILPLGDNDLIAIRSKTGFLPEVLPEKEEGETTEDAEPETQEKETPETEDKPEGELSTPRPFTLAPGEEPTTIEHLYQVEEGDIARAVNKFEQWAVENAPEFASLLKAKVKPSEK